MQRLIRYGAYPVVAIGALVLLMSIGINGTGYQPVFLLIVLIGSGLVALLERVLPYEAGWNADHGGDTRADTIHFFVGILLFQSSILTFYQLEEPLPMTWMIWPRQLDFPLQVLLAGLILDFGLYAMHRFSHVHGLLWRLHSIHHQPERLYWLNGSRRHPLSALVLAGPALIVLFMLGATPGAVAVWLSFMSIHLAFQHANLDYRLGPFRKVLAVAETHRWHHKRDHEDAQVNFGEVLLVWDHLFGSYHDKVLRLEKGEVGLRGYALPSSYWLQLKWPFQ